MSFVSVLNKLETTLKTDADLNAFCQGAWKKPVSVELVFKHRTEISLSDLPLVLITRPALVKRQHMPYAEKAVHQVRMYAGFLQKTAQLAQSQQVGFEEAISNAVTKDGTLGGLALWAGVNDAVNDEGVYHPSYFTVIDIEICFQREKP